MSGSNSLSVEKLKEIFEEDSVAVRVLRAKRKDLVDKEMAAIARDKDDRVLAALGRNANVANEILWELADASQPRKVRKAVADNRAASDDLLILLSGDPYSRIRFAVINNPATSTFVKKFIARDDRYYEVRKELATKEEFDVEILEILALDSNPKVRAAVATNKISPTILLDLLSTDDDAQVRCSVAANRKVSQETYVRLAFDSDRSVCLALAANGCVGPEALEILIEHWILDIVILKTIIEHAWPIPVKLIFMLLRSENVDFYSLLAIQRDPPNRALLRELAKSSNEKVLVAVAKNEGCPEDTLVFLVSLQKPPISEAVAGNGQCLPRLLNDLARDPNPSVRRAVAANRAAPAEALLRLARDPFDDIREIVAANEQTPPAVLALLSQDEESVVVAVASNPATTIDILLQMIDGDHLGDEVLCLMAKHRAATGPLLERLYVASDDENMKIACAGHPKTPQWILRELIHKAKSTMVVRLALIDNEAFDIADFEALIRYDAKSLLGLGDAKEDRITNKEYQEHLFKTYKSRKLRAKKMARARRLGMAASE